MVFTGKIVAVVVDDDDEMENTTKHLGVIIEENFTAKERRRKLIKICRFCIEIAM